MTFESDERPCYRMFDEFARLAARAQYLTNLQKFVSPDGSYTDWKAPISEEKRKFYDANSPSYSVWFEKNIARKDDVKCKIPIGMFQMMALFNEAIEFEVSEFEERKRNRISGVKDVLEDEWPH